MMQDNSPYYLLVFICMGLMLFNALKKDKQLIHYLFVIFCGSLCMVGVQKLSAQSLGSYQYFIGLFTCATCNVVWLISRTLFREHKPISALHISLAAIIAGLIMFNQTWHYLVSLELQPLPESHIMWRLKQGMNEITGLLSSCILVLSFWEAVRAYKGKGRSQQFQSIIFASAYFLAVFNASILPNFIFSAAEIQRYNPFIIVSSALLITIAIQIVMVLQEKQRGCHSAIDKHDTLEQETVDVAPQLIAAIDKLMNTQQLYLKNNLKLSDLAQALSVPEYRVSRAVRYHYKAANFNLFINQYRVKRAQQILLSEEAKDWSILSVALDSGFSSLATFNRVFKSIAGVIPNEFRRQKTA